VSALKAAVKAGIERLSMPAHLRAARRDDRLGLPSHDPGPDRVIAEGVAWLCFAQDHSTSQDGGVARHFSLVDGWADSYPETTGYIVDTFIVHGEKSGNAQLIWRAHRMLDWLVSIQFPEGAFQGGTVNLEPHLPATFDTGQILIGLAAGTRIDLRYREPMIRAADWLVETQDPDGCWRKHDTPFVVPGEKVYETHAALGLFRAATAASKGSYAKAAAAQVDWAIGHQRPNGWLDKCCLTDSANPLTHTLGYGLRGIVEAYVSTREAKFLEAACRTADGLMGAFEPDGRLPGRLNEHWQPAADWVCLTGTSQIAESLLMLSGLAKRDDYRRVALRANAFVRRTIIVDGRPEIRGAVKGSFPIDGWYGRWQYLNWACKFMIDANRAELADKQLTEQPIARHVADATLDHHPKLV